MVALAGDKLLQQTIKKWDDLNPQVARRVLELGFGKRAISRMNWLSARASEGTLTPAQDAELQFYIDFGDLLAIAQSKARVALRKRKGNGR